MKIAILSAGLDHRKDRGYENSSRNLFESLKKEKIQYLEVFLFKGSGKQSENEIVLKSFIDLNFLAKWGWKLIGDSYGLEYILFALQFIIYANRKGVKFDTIYTQEPRVSKTLFRFKRLLPGKPILVYTMGINLTPEHYINVSDRVHLVNIEHYKAAVEAYPDAKKFYLIPNPASDSKKYSGNKLKKDLLEKYKVQTSKIVLSVGAIDAHIKRMDYVIQEVSKLDNSWSLVLCGKVYDPTLINLGVQLLGRRFINVLLPPDEVSEVYALADIFVLSSLIEGFGNVTIEAMQNSLPVLLHKRELNEWIVEDIELLVDMTKEGALSDKIREKASEEWLREKGENLNLLFHTKYQWGAVKNMYLKLLEVK
ncbi:glycosyltransferase family 4 protein [Pontibacter vulgaris]|uniref:glycosyltransferase family 4 protein n=1 Tax=Pontibacter vulgaris TaxID=2905679 RepID=UPI001FA7D5F1|nr:glycosyltransferase family 4 protein [Pontibacter vulgaris]